MIYRDHKYPDPEIRCDYEVYKVKDDLQWFVSRILVNVERRRVVSYKYLCKDGQFRVCGNVAEFPTKQEAVGALITHLRVRHV